MLFRSLTLVLLSLTLTACNITGSAQKGPMKLGSPISASQLNAQGDPVNSTTINTEVFSTQGSFSVDRIKWSGWTGLTATGAFFNELSNTDSEVALTLNAITRKDKRFDTANLHLFSHLAAARILQRISDGQNRNNAWRDTQTEMIQLFDLKSVSRNFNRGVEQLSLLNGSGFYRNDNANLLLFTGAFLAIDGDPSSLQVLADDFADDGQFNGIGQASFAAIASAANNSGLLATLSQNLKVNGASNPPNQNDQQQLPAWVNTDGGNVDTTAPVITIGSDEITLVQGADFIEDVSAEDNVDGDISNDVVITGTVDTDTVGTYTLTYNVSDAAGNPATTVTRTVEVTSIPDTTAPVISIGSAEISLNQGEVFIEDVSAEDNIDGDITEKVVISGTVDTAKAGVYIINYDVSDAATNAAATVTRTVTVNDITAPIISIGNSEISLDQGDVFVEDASAEDDTDGDISTKIVISGEVDTTTAGVYILTYNVSDAASNPAATVTRTVNVNDITAPIISIGSSEISLDQGDVFVEDASAEDDTDGDISTKIVISGEVDTTAAGVYILTYNVSDAASNPATTVTRTVTINDITAPVISIGSSTVRVDQGDIFVDDVSASDDTDGDITEDIVISGELDTDSAGSYTLTYNVSDDAGNAAETVTRTVEVIAVPIELSSVNVRITNPAGEVLGNVSITAISSNESSSEFGPNRQGIVELELNADAEYALRLELDGYATQVLQVKSPLAGEQIDLEVTMIERGEIQTFIAEDGATLIGEKGASVEIGPNSFETLAGGEVSGEIQVTITPVDVSNSSSLDAFPGEFIGIQTDTTETPIISFGTVEYKFTQNGQELQLAEGSAAVIQIPIYIPTYQNGSDIVIGDLIPLWSLNENTGVWLQESADVINPGFGRVVASEQSPTGLALEAIVDHFTWWNCDVSMNSGTANVSVSTNNPSFTGTAVITATVEPRCNIGWRPSNVSRSVAVGGSANGLAVPSSCQVCWSAELILANSQIVTSNYQCGAVGPNQSVDIDLNIVESGLPLGILADEEEVLSKTALIGFAADRVQLRPTTIEESISYSIVSGSLPPGLSLIQKNTIRAEIVGEPSEIGEFSVVIQGTGSTGTETDLVTVNYSVIDPTISGLPLFMNDPINLSFRPFGGFLVGFDGPRVLDVNCDLRDEICDPNEQTQSYDLNLYNVGTASNEWLLEVDNDSLFQTLPPDWLILSAEGILTIDQDNIPNNGRWSGQVKASNAAGNNTTRLVVCIDGIDSDCARNTPVPGGEAELQIRFRENPTSVREGIDPGTFFFEILPLGIIDGVYLNNEQIAGGSSVSCNQSDVDLSTPGTYDMSCSYFSDLEDSVTSILTVSVTPAPAQ